MQKKIFISQEQLNEYITQGLSQQQIADLLGVSRQGLHKYRIKHRFCRSIDRSDKGIERVPKEIKAANNRKHQATYYQKHGNRKRNKRIRLKIMTKVLHRAPEANEVLHHVDGNPGNYEHSNLVICDQSYHISVLHQG